MRVRVAEDDFEYQIRTFITNFKERYDLQDYDGEDLANIIYDSYQGEFGRDILELIDECFGENIFCEEE